MTIDYAKAYSRERMAHAEIQRLQRAMGGGRLASLRRLRKAIGRTLIDFGERLSAAPAAGVSASSVTTRIRAARQ